MRKGRAVPDTGRQRAHLVRRGRDALRGQEGRNGVQGAPALDIELKNALHQPHSGGVHRVTCSFVAFLTARTTLVLVRIVVFILVRMLDVYIPQCTPSMWHMTGLRTATAPACGALQDLSLLVLGNNPSHTGQQLCFWGLGAIRHGHDTQSDT